MDFRGEISSSRRTTNEKDYFNPDAITNATLSLFFCLRFVWLSNNRIRIKEAQTWYENYQLIYLPIYVYSNPVFFFLMTRTLRTLPQHLMDWTGLRLSPGKKKQLIKFYLFLMARIF